MRNYAIIVFFLIFLSSSLTTHAQKQALEQRNIDVNYNQKKGSLCKNALKCIGAGRANEGLRADWQAQLKLIQTEIKFEYIRMHGLLSDDMGVYFEDPNGNPIYNWQYIDKLFDFLQSIGLKPFVELGFMPNALASDNKTVFWWKGNITPPKSYEKWNDLIKNLILHCEERYGKEEIKTWYFEVWNEPDLNFFFSGSFDDYCKMYLNTVTTIKKISKEYKVGGPASAIPFDYEKRFVEYCATNQIPVDFVSTHAYGVKAGFFDASGNSGTVIDSDTMAVSGRMQQSRKLIQQSKLPYLELHFTEWSSSYTPTDPIHDTYQQASFILDKIKNAQEFVNSMSYWVFTDIFEENGPRQTPFHGGFGLLNYQDIKKPAFFAYKYLSQLGNTELVNNDKASWACKDDNGNIQILLWDFTINTPPDSVNNQVFYKQVIPSVPKGNITISIKDIPEGTYLLEQYATGFKRNDAYTYYTEMGSPKQLTIKQENALKDLSDGTAESIKVITISKDKAFKLTLPYCTNDLLFLKLEKL